MNPRLINILCLVLLIGLAIWSLFLWHDGKAELAIFVAVWALVGPAAVRAIASI